MLRQNLTAFAIAFIIAIPLSGYCQDEVIHMNHRELGIHERPIVKFPHAIHEDKIDCIRCHHNFDEYGANTGSEGEKCTSCHGAKKNLISPKEAFHLQCINCHRNLMKNGLKYGPIMCAECHKKSSTEQAKK